MRLFKRIWFALTHEIEPYYIVVPYGEPWEVCRFSKYEDALKFTHQQQAEKPMRERPSILVIVEKLRVMYE